MNYSSELSIWILNILFIIGILLIPVGVGFMIFPEKIFKLASRLNHWIETDTYFQEINKPRYKEVFLYRHHRIFGVIIFIISILCLYMLTLYIGMGTIIDNLNKLAESEFEKWLFVVFYYLLIFTNMLAVIFGAIMFKRPSILKTFESWSNRWIDTDTPLKVLDNQKNLPDRILPGNPRIFGFFVFLGAVYIIWSTAPL